LIELHRVHLDEQLIARSAYPSTPFAAIGGKDVLSPHIVFARFRPHRAVLLASLLAGCAASQAPTGSISSTDDFDKQKKPALSFTLPRLGGGTVSLARLRGRPVLIHLFTTWSLRAQAEAAEIVRMYDVYSPRGLKVVGIALDRRARALIETYVQFVKFRFPVALAQPRNLELIGALGPTKQVPRTVLVGANGRVVQDHHRGQTNFPRLLAAIEALLKRPKASPL
jgi:peroxiredoxin